MSDKMKKKHYLILNILKEADRPLGSAQIREELLLAGHDISERSIRLYLQELDDSGLTEKHNQRKRRISQTGLKELEATKIIERVGFLSARIDQMTFRMNFDLTTRTGTVVINVTVVAPRQVQKNLRLMSKVFECGYSMGELMTLLPPGETLGHITIPDGMVGLGTVCSITLNGVLLKYGIPTVSRFGGLLEIEEQTATRFVEIIMYDGTSLDPLEIFIRSGMTDYTGAVTTGSGRIGASFREFPADSQHMVDELAQRLHKIGLGGFMRIGRPGQTLLDIPVGASRVGAIVIGGLNPVAILEENGVRAHSRALAGLIDFSRLFHYSELGERLKAYR
ncbi:MAG TPA: NrpR regulatory domain-containing protein [Deltaproteobacteria bacterium]|nr:NrpR regulatory domain-containing protein [Deltaproteobacteria bacterium]